ncbi:LOW QUALITY PROTEIN: osteoclast stimulatory transmembrane protein [Gymnodraco acuticeps]|uniref:LOW QUALITY PROTEIN: osteoclast stimulatory transmembrane protein n=1 Tax=Gymnodraco acuticeps TaxID=8218 RepID=A0A6P8WB63_GYMAC|nr:LOW QUALITY PROTEIN: osteoclast stimulatory transmembrane protein [Gymnodraco acuticeps]
MKLIPEDIITAVRSSSCRQVLSSALLHLWDVFSAPAPQGRNLLTLLVLCFSLALLTGLLMLLWLSDSLRYSSQTCLLTSSIYSVSIFLLSSLIPPLRCVLTLSLPTVCTRQGRKLLLTASVMILVLNVIPNISSNVGSVARILKCTAEGFTRTLLNSSEPLNAAKKDLVLETIKVRREDLSLVTNLRKLDLFTHVDLSAVKSRFGQIIAQIEGDFSHARNTLKHYKLLSNRVLAAMFVAALIFESARYLKSYLGSVQFDNEHVSKEDEADRKGCPTSCRMSGQEFTSCFLSLLVVTLYFMAITLVVALDHVVFLIVQAALPWVLEFPPTTASISVDYKVKWFPPALCLIPELCFSRELTHFHRDYSWTFDPEPSLCEASVAPPSPGVSLLLGFLWILSYLLVFIEVYARRLRRNISASFFREQEERRREYRREKEVQEEQRKQKHVTSVLVR